MRSANSQTGDFSSASSDTSLQANLYCPPFIAKVSHRLPRTTCEQRQVALEKAGYNVFNLSSSVVSGGDYLTDSGTGGLLDTQRSAMEMNDESYAGSQSFLRFESAFQHYTGMKHVLPVHQGRAAERLLFGYLVKPGDIVVSNSLFDTTRAHVEQAGALGLDLPMENCYDFSTWHPFKGNMDCEKLKAHIAQAQANGQTIACCVLTVTNNTGGGQPVAMANIRHVSDILKPFNIPLIIDAARFAENAYFIQQRETGYHDISIETICREMFSYAAGFTMSAKKDGLANMGGVIAFQDDDWHPALKASVILNEGFINYGGISGRDLECIAQGLHEVLDVSYLENRIGEVAYLGQLLHDAGVPVLWPTGGHAVYVDAGSMFPHLTPSQLPGQSLVCNLYLRSGIRACEMGSVMFGVYENGILVKPHRREMVRFAIPRLTYSRDHLYYLAQHLIQLKRDASEIEGMSFVFRPEVLPHFSATFQFQPGSAKINAVRMNNPDVTIALRNE